ncbi:hypothetical protein CsSME_00024055 [Camellia sinensis var. sinensis]
MSMFFMEGNSSQPPKRLEVSKSSNGEDDEEWSLISEMHSRHLKGVISRTLSFVRLEQSLQIVRNFLERCKIWSKN